MSFSVSFKNENAKMPTRASKGDAGYDLYACEDKVISARKRGLIDTGISINIPSDCYGRIAPRSGLAVKNGIDVLAGVVDSSYRGIIKVVIQNNDDVDFEVRKGDRIAQMVFERIYTPELKLVDELDQTERGEKGFGSSGSN